MGIEYFLFGLYLLFTFWFIPYLPFVKKAHLTQKETRLLLGFKIIGGLICAVYFKKIATNVDYLFFNAEGLAQYELLLNNPTLFFSDFSNDLSTYGLGGLFETKTVFGPISILTSSINLSRS